MTTAKAPKIKVDVKGDERAARELTQLGVRAEDVRPVRRGLESIFHRAEARQFTSRGAGEWQPLAEATRLKKAKLGENAAILRATDRLYRSLTADGRDQIATFLKGKIKLGSKVPYSPFHKTGTATMPARPPIDLRPAETSQMSELIGHYIAEGKT